MNPLVCFVDPYRLFCEVEVRWGECQHFSLPDSAPVQHLEGVVRHGLVHDCLCEFHVLLLRPEVHFLPFFASDAAHLGGRIAFQPIVPYRMVQDRHQLVMYRFQVGSRVRLFEFIPIGQQLILPGDDVLGFNFAHHHFPKGRDQPVFDDVFLCQPGAFLQAWPPILFIEPAEGFEGHIDARCVLLHVAPFPILRLFFCFKAALAFLTAFTLPVVIPGQRIPFPGLFVLID